jgi:hypothetical protein
MYEKGFCDFQKNLKQVILMESQQGASPGFDISVSAPKRLHTRSQRSLRERERQSVLSKV